MNVFVAAEQLDSRAVIRAQAIEAWVSLALENPDPEAWANALIASALDRLNTVQETLPVKAEARLQILDTQRAILAGITKSQNKQRLAGDRLIRQSDSPNPGGTGWAGSPSRPAEGRGQGRPR